MISTDQDRHNGWIFSICYILTYLSAPVLYIDVVQASLLDKLGASPTVANLPASTYMFGQIAPLFVCWLVPHRLERSMVVWANIATAAFIGIVFASLAVPVPDEVRIAALTLQGLLQGLSGSTSFVFMMQCLRRGTSEPGLARALKRTFGVTPLAAVAGSLGAQYVLNPGFASLPYPYDFALLYLLAMPCSAGIAAAASRFHLEPIEEKVRPPYVHYLGRTLRGFGTDRRMLSLWIAYVFWYAAISVMSNLTLYTRVATGADPKDYSGLMMAIRFGTKAAAGVALGMLAVRYGLRAGVMGTLVLAMTAAVWGWSVPGWAFLLTFGLMGGAELGGVYQPNYVSRLSTPSESTMNLAMMTLATPVSSFAPVLHGFLATHLGFPASFLASGLFAATALWLVWVRGDSSPSGANP